MAFSRATVKYKPLRIGFLVRSGEIEDIIEASRVACLLWGGVYNPIIPIGAGDNKFAKQLMDLFEVDILYPVAESEHITAFRNEYPFLRTPAHHASDITYEDWDTKKKAVGLLDTIHAINLYWDRQFRHKPKEYKSDFLLPAWDENDDLSNVFAVQFGEFPDMEDFKSDYVKAFKNGLRAKELELAVEDNLDIDVFKNWTPLDLTKTELKGYGGGPRMDSTGLYLGSPSNFHDLANFWNLRASGVEIVFASEAHVERQQGMLQKYLDKPNNRPTKRPDIPRLISLYGIDLDEDRVNKFKENLASERPFLPNNVSETSWNGLNIKPSYYVFKWQSASTQVEQAYDKYVVNVKLPPKNFLIDYDDDLDSDRQNMAAIISPYSGSHIHSGYTFDLPYTSELNEFYSREISIDPWGLRVNRENFTIVLETREDEVSLYPIEINDLVHKLLESCGIKATVSQPGRIAQRLIEKMDGVNGGRFLKIKGVRMLLNQGSAQSTVSKGEATKVIFENDFTKHERLFIEAREQSKLTSEAVFGYLLKHEYFRAGLDLTCENCKLHSWLSLNDICDKWECEYCGAKNLTSSQLKNRGDWKFRKSGLFAKDNNQEGSIPVVLTLMLLEQMFSHNDFIYTTALELKGDDLSCETDFCVLEQNHYNRFSICIGEAKSDGGEITQEDCDNMKRVAGIITDKYPDAKVYVAMAKTSDDFTKEEIERFKKLSEDCELILFTERELERYRPYWKEDGGIDDNVPEKYPNSFADLSRNSHHRYLSDTNETG